jgi:hypothetical protein
MPSKQSTPNAVSIAGRPQANPPASVSIDHGHARAGGDPAGRVRDCAVDSGSQVLRRCADHFRKRDHKRGEDLHGCLSLGLAAFALFK